MFTIPCKTTHLGSIGSLFYILSILTALPYYAKGFIKDISFFSSSQHVTSEEHVCIKQLYSDLLPRFQLALKKSLVIGACGSTCLSQSRRAEWRCSFWLWFKPLADAVDVVTLHNIICYVNCFIFTCHNHYTIQYMLYNNAVVPEMSSIGHVSK